MMATPEMKAETRGKGSAERQRQLVDRNKCQWPHRTAATSLTAAGVCSLLVVTHVEQRNFFAQVEPRVRNRQSAHQTGVLPVDDE